MNPTIKLCLCVLTSALIPSFANADEPSVEQWAHKRVTSGLVKPLQEQEANRSRFSRAMIPAKDRRLRILQTSTSRDKQGREFVPYAVDVASEDDWEHDFSGCVYRATGHIFVSHGNEYRPAEFLLGKDRPVIAGVCQQAPPPPDKS